MTECQMGRFERLSLLFHFENRKNANGLPVNVAIYMMAINETVADITCPVFVISSLTKKLLGVYIGNWTNSNRLHDNS